jgi:hypothetical protein
MPSQVYFGVSFKDERGYEEIAHFVYLFTEVDD